MPRPLCSLTYVLEKTPRKRMREEDLLVPS